MASALSSLTVELVDGVDPLSLTTEPRSKANRVRAAVRLLLSLLTGSRKGTLRVASAQAQAVVTAATVVNGNTVTLNGQALTATQHNATGTLTIDNGENMSAGDKFTIAGVQFTAAVAAASRDEFTIGADAAGTATAIAAAVNAHADARALVTASAAARVVTFRAVAGGTAGNAIGLTEDVDAGSGGAFAVSGATLANGATVANNQFDFTGTDAQTAAALAAAVVASTTAAVNTIVTATASGAEVTIKAKVKGTAGNAITIASSGATLAITGGVSRLAGGAESSYQFGSAA